MAELPDGWEFSHSAPDEDYFYCSYKSMPSVRLISVFIKIGEGAEGKVEIEIVRYGMSEDESLEEMLKADTKRRFWEWANSD